LILTSHTHATGHEPLNTLKPVAGNLWIIDGQTRWLGMPYPARCTVIRLASGDLWVHSPTTLTDDLRTALGALGPVRHVIAPNWRQAANIADWRRAYPAAKVHALPGAAEYVAKRGDRITADHDLDQDAPAAWSADIKQTIITGSRADGEAVFLHRPSQSLIVASLIESIETARLPAWARPIIWIAGIDDSDGKMRLDRRMRFRKAALAHALERMIAWQPERLILAHGRWYTRDAVGELRRAFRRNLRDREWIAAMDRIEADRARKGD